MEDNSFVPHGDRRSNDRRAQDPSVDHAMDPASQERRVNGDRRIRNPEDPDMLYTLWH